MSAPIKTISLSALQLSVENPRFDLVGNQREAIQVMVEDQGEKLIRLAKDIIDFGQLNPTEFVSVTPSASDKDKFIVLEGNRRVAVLKLLSNPDLITQKHKGIKDKFKQLSKAFKAAQIHEVSCVVFADPEDASKWIKLRHTGENDGIGVVRWDAQQVARFDERIGGESPIVLQALDFMRKERTVAQAIKDKLKKVPSSSLSRLLADKNVQQVIGIAIKDNKIQTSLQKPEVIKGLTKIIGDLADKKIKVKNIYTKEDRERYIETFKPTEVADKTKLASSTWELVSPNQPSSKNKPKKPASLPLSTARENIIPRDCIMKISNIRINKIYLELKGLNVDVYENAAAILLRVFIEQSVDAFIDEYKLPKVNKDNKLRVKIEAVAKYLEGNSLLNKYELKPIRTAASNPHSILSVDTFNAYVHNRHLAPIPNDLKTAWDNMQKFVETIWQNIK